MDKIAIYIQEYKAHRKINRDFFELLPEENYDFKMTNKSDSPRESLIHLIEIQQTYFNAIKDRLLVFG